MKKGKKRKRKNNMKNTEQKRIRGRKDNEENVEKERRINLGKKEGEQESKSCCRQSRFAQIYGDGNENNPHHD